MEKEITNLTDESLIQKSNPMLCLAQSDLALAELKIWDAYLAKIDMKNPDSYTVTFTHQELCRMTGVERIRKEDLEKRTKNLGQLVKLFDNKNHSYSIGLVGHVEIKNESGELTMEMKCTEEAKKFIFNVEELGYVNYRIKQTANLTSRYSYWMANYLLKYKGFKTEWNISIDKLKQIIGFHDKDVEYKYFKKMVLNKMKSDLDNSPNTDVSFDYTPIRTGRFITHLHIILIDKAPKLDGMGNYIGSATEEEVKDDKADKATKNVSPKKNKSKETAPLKASKTDDAENPEMSLIEKLQGLCKGVSGLEEGNYLWLKITDSLNDKIEGLVVHYGIEDEPDDSDNMRYRALVAKNIKIGYLVIDNYKDENSLKMVIEVYDVICDIVCNRRKMVTISGVDYFWNIVKSQFLKLDYDKVKRVVNRIVDAELNIKNVYSYLLTALYKASMSETMQETSEYYDDYLRSMSDGNGVLK